MSEKIFGHSVIFSRKRTQSKQQINNKDQNQASMDGNNQLSFELNYQLHNQTQNRKRSQQLPNYSQFNKIKFKQPVSALTKLPAKLSEPSPCQPSASLSLNFDLFNPKKRSKLTINRNLERFQEINKVFKEKYFQRIQRINKKKYEKCKVVNSYGLNIKIAEKFQNQEKSPKKYGPKSISPDKEDEVNRKHSLQTVYKESIKKRKMPFIRHCESGMGANKLFLESLYTSQELKQQRAVQQAIRSYNVVLTSFGCYLVNQNSAKESKFKYFVGNGNNRQIVCSVFKKRWWWTQTNNPLSANFVWTQLNHSQTLARLECLYPDSTPQINLSILKASNLSKQQQSAKNPNLSSSFFHPHLNHKFQKHLPDSHKRKFLKPFQAPQCCHNHFSHNFMLGDKKALFSNLSSYYSYKQENVYDIIPLTFFIQNCQSKQLEEFQRYAVNKPNSIWIVKPGQNSNRGKGIFLTNQPQLIRKKLIHKKNKHTYVVQQYLTNLLLYQNRKFDIRTYMLVISIRGVTKYFWYNQGYIRTSSEFFSTKDLSNLYIHLTNDAVQIKNSNYGHFQSGNKISYEQFQRYLDFTLPQANLSMEKLNQRMKDIATEAVRANQHKIDPQQKMYSFQLFGLDFLIDSQFRPWLIEINTNPCLELSSPVLERLIPTMLENIFRIAVDPIFQPTFDVLKSKAFYLYENCLERNKFQLIFDSLFDLDPQWISWSSSQLPSKEQQQISQITLSNMLVQANTDIQ